MGETYFATGATGFVGTRLTAALIESGARVKCLVRPTSRRDALEKLGVEFVEGDLFDLDALNRGIRGVDGVFHLAGAVRELKNEFDSVNRVGVRNVAAACAAAGKESGKTPVLVSVSSLAGAGPAPRVASGREDADENKGGSRNEKRTKSGRRKPRAASEISAAGATFREYPIRLKRETDLPNPVSPYGRSKIAGERELLFFSDQVPTTIVRPPYVFGPGDALSLELFKMAKRRGIFVLPGWIDRCYSFVEVGDLTTLLIAAMERGERAAPTSLDPIPTRADAGSGAPASCSGRGIYFATSPIPVRFSEFGAAIGAGYGRKVRTIKVPPVGVIGAGVYGEIFKKLAKKPAPLDWNKAREALSGPWICSDAKAFRQLGVRFETPLVEQFKNAAEWYERAGWV